MTGLFYGGGLELLKLQTIGFAGVAAWTAVTITVTFLVIRAIVGLRVEREEELTGLDAAATVLMNMLGLVCDPVGGLVEYPCQNRNAAGVANALIAAELALSGIRQLIPFDEMLDTMYQVGKRIPYELRETALGGCAASPSGCRFCHGHG